jgi:hypothetical protein
MRRSRVRGSLVLSTLLLATASLFAWAPGCGSETARPTSASTSGTPPDCVAAADCDDQNPCTEDACTDGACVSTPGADRLLDDPTPGDCETDACEAGELVDAPLDTDIRDDGQDCTIDSCEDGHAVHTLKPDDTPCTVGGEAGFCSGGVCAGVECDEQTPCPDDGNPCTEDSCDLVAGECVFAPLDGVPTPGVVPEDDCIVHQCVGGVDTVLVDDSEIPDDDNDCTDDLCTDGVPSNPPKVVNTACGDQGDLVCDGAGTCGECNPDKVLEQCPFTPPCETPTCQNHTCGKVFNQAGDPSPAQIAGDCKRVVCDGAGGTTIINDDTDPPSDGNDCTSDLCSGGVATHPSLPALSACAGGLCDGAGVCKKGFGQACAAPGDCGSGLCVDGVCCDSICAGPCDACSIAAGAPADGTCALLPASAIGNPSCSPYLCSGATSSCAVSCAGDADCSAPYYCSGGLCVPDDPQGTPCALASHCASGFCADGVCCDAACNGLCVACTAALKGAGQDGACGGIAAGTDPANECPASTCKTGLCGGNGACGDSPAGTACGSAISCVGTIQVNQDTCNGAASCVDNGTSSCAPYTCAGTTCKSSCSTDLDCSSGNYCSASACIAKKTGGTVCAAANECSSGFCVDGVCCGSASCAVCQACNLNGLGTCSSMPAGAKDNVPPAVCPANQSCDGSGACKDDNGQPCASGATCASALCVDAVCCGSACGSACDACSVAAGGTADGTCTPVVDGAPGAPACSPYLCDGVSSTCPSTCVTNADCAGGFFCNGGVCSGQKGQGAICSQAGECASGFCVDGVCCNASCTGVCAACTAAKKGGGVDGACGNILVNTDPDNECTSSECAFGVCDGFGACANQPFGAACGDTASCASSLRTLADGCSGSGTCIDYGTQSCGLYQCVGVNCGSTCVADGDCIAAAYCAAGVCMPDCAQDSDCQASEYCTAQNKCASKGSNGAACSAANQCTSGFCADGVCCSTACTSFCQACTALKKGSGSDGTCANITNLDPDNECPATECTTGLCLNGGCSNLTNGTFCGDSASCSSGLQTNQDTCSAGVCNDKGTVACGNYACSGTLCLSACSNDSQCAAGAYCNANSACVPFCFLDSDCFGGEFCNLSNNRCTPKLAVGTACTTGNQCTGNNCVDGVCCSSACGGFCQACTAAKKGSGADGTCGSIVNLDPDNECPNVDCKTGVCNGSNQCGNLSSGALCGDSASCSSGVQTNQDTCNASGTCIDKGTTACGAYTCGATACLTSCTTDVQCAAGNYCKNAATCTPLCFLDSDCVVGEYCDLSTNHCATKLATGTACSTSNQCTTNSCVDGYCCGTACTNACKSCGLAGALGTCTNIPQGFTDSSPACNGVSACSGAGVCKLANGQPCTLNSQCASATCSSSICKGAAGQPCSAGTHCVSGVCLGTGLCQ